MIIFERGRFRLTKAAGLRFGFGWTPHYKVNKDISRERAQSIIVWCGPYFVTVDFHKRGYEPRIIWNNERLKSLRDAQVNLGEEIARALRAKVRWQRHLDMGRRYGMGSLSVQEMLADRRTWQAQSDAVKLREMERAERDDKDPRD